MAKQAPGKSYRKGLTLVQLMDMFLTEEAATEWFESVIWPKGRRCPKCGSTRTRGASHKRMPYWCSDCRGYFVSVREPPVFGDIGRRLSSDPGAMAR